MTIRNLAPLLRPASIALVGASARPGTLGAVVLENVMKAGFAGPVYAVNPHRLDREGVTWVSRVQDLPAAPDLAIVMTPPETVPRIIADLGDIGTRCAVVISAGVTEASGLRQQMLDAAKPHLLRVIGPNCLGIMAPHARLDATFASTPAEQGGLALISQSGALITAVLDWAQTRKIGFSGIVSAGDMADIDIGDLIDLFAADPQTNAILLYLEGITDAAKFLSAARAAARIKPVIAIKAGRSPAAAKAALSHTGALAGSYEVYRAAFERAGIVAVDTLTEVFDAAEILRTRQRIDGDRLGIVTNGGGAGILAVDMLATTGATLAPLSPATVASLDTHLPPGWSRANPVDMIGDATADRYAHAIRALLRDETVDALLVMNCPTGKTEGSLVAAALIEEVHRARAAHIDKPVLACWLGDANAAGVRSAMTEARVPVYATPEDAVRAFGYLVAARRAQLSLTGRPATRRELTPDVPAAERIIAAVRADNRILMTAIEAMALLDAFKIQTVQTRFAPSVESVEAACGGLHPPFVVKIVSHDINHKSDLGGVALDLHVRGAATAAARTMQARIAREHPEAHITGFAIQEMIARPHARELIVGITTDPTFGPLVMVGAGGTAVEIIGDTALDLAPIDHAQALDLIARTRIAKLLAGYRNEPAGDVDAVARVLDALSAMCVSLPDIVELDINPLLVDARGVIALDARIRIAPEPVAQSRLAIMPAPMQWASDLVTQQGRRIFVRPVRADDDALLADFFTHVSPEDLRFRFMSAISTVSHEQIAMMTRVDYRRTISFLAFDEARETVLATAMLAADSERAHAEVALTTRADVKKQGLSWALFEHVLRYAKAVGIETVEAIECADHDAAIQMEREMGFVSEADPMDSTMRIVRRVFAADAAS